MQLYLNEYLWLEGGLVPTTVAVLQLLAALSCLHIPVSFYPGKENKLLLGRGPQERISILHFIMLAIF